MLLVIITMDQKFLGSIQLWQHRISLGTHMLDFCLHILAALLHYTLHLWFLLSKLIKARTTLRVLNLMTLYLLQDHCLGARFLVLAQIFVGRYRFSPIELHCFYCIRVLVNRVHLRSLRLYELNFQWIHSSWEMVYSLHVTSCWGLYSHLFWLWSLSCYNHGALGVYVWLEDNFPYQLNSFNPVSKQMQLKLTSARFRWLYMVRCCASGDGLYFTLFAPLKFFSSSKLPCRVSATFHGSAAEMTVQFLCYFVFSTNEHFKHLVLSWI